MLDNFLIPRTTSIDVKSCLLMTQQWFEDAVIMILRVHLVSEIGLPVHEWIRSDLNILVREVNSTTAVQPGREESEETLGNWRTEMILRCKKARKPEKNSLDVITWSHCQPCQHFLGCRLQRTCRQPWVVWEMHTQCVTHWWLTLVQIWSGSPTHSQGKWVGRPM